MTAEAKRLALDPSILGPKAREWYEQSVPCDPLWNSPEATAAFEKLPSARMASMATIPEYLLPSDAFNPPLCPAHEKARGKGKQKPSQRPPCEVCGEVHTRGIGPSVKQHKSVDKVVEESMAPSLPGFLDQFPFLAVEDGPFPPHIEEYIVFLQRTTIMERFRYLRLATEYAVVDKKQRKEIDKLKKLKRRPATSQARMEETNPSAEKEIAELRAENKALKETIAEQKGELAMKQQVVDWLLRMEEGHQIPGDMKIGLVDTCPSYVVV